MFGMVRFILRVDVYILAFNQFGCDSTATLNLTINNISSSSFDATACDSYDWNGLLIQSVRTFSTTNQFVVFNSNFEFKLILPSSSFDATACDSCDWNGTTYTESGTYTNTTNQFGCDSTAT